MAHSRGRVLGFTVVAVVCFVLCAVAVGLSIFSNIPTTVWYRYTYIGYGPAEETRKSVVDNHGTDSPIRKMWDILVPVMIVGAAAEAAVALLILLGWMLSCLTKGGMHRAVAWVMRVITVLAALLGFAALAFVCVFYAFRHQKVASWCSTIDSLPWCTKFFGEDSLHNKGEPGIGWILEAVSAVVSLLSLLLSVVVHAH